MLSLARNGYTAAQVEAALKYSSGSRTMLFRYLLLDKNNQPILYLKNVTAGSVANDTTAQIKRTAKFAIHDDGSIDFLSNRIQPWAWLLMPDGGYAKFPLGVFLLSTPPREVDAARTATRQVDGYDQLQILVDDKVTDRYTIPQGTNYIDAVRTILTGAGIQQMNLTPTNLTLPADQDWDPATPKLQIVDDLTDAINYRKLCFDEVGMAQGLPYVTPAQRGSEFVYADDANSVMFPEVKQGKDLFALPNQWVLVVSEADYGPLRSVYTNQNPNSPTSTVNRGRTVVKYMDNQYAADQATLDALAQKLAYQDSQVYETIEFPSAIMPIHSDFDVYTLTNSDIGVSDKVSEIAWSFELKDGARMMHTVQRVVSV